MMSVKEYANDTNHSVAEILKKCSELGIDVKYISWQEMCNKEEMEESLFMFLLDSNNPSVQMYALDYLIYMMS